MYSIIVWLQNFNASHSAAKMPVVRLLQRKKSKLLILNGFIGKISQNVLFYYLIFTFNVLLNVHLFNY